MASGASPPPAAPSLQSGLEQLEAGIEQALGYVDSISPLPNAKEAGGAKVDGAVDTLRRCQGDLEVLNQRLTNIVDTVGKL
jgi:hypothetical protein